MIPVIGAPLLSPALRAHGHIDPGPVFFGITGDIAHALPLLDPSQCPAPGYPLLRP